LTNNFDKFLIGTDFINISKEINQLNRENKFDYSTTKIKIERSNIKLGFLVVVFVDKITDTKSKNNNKKGEKN
jgi:hypothetical protein